ncbi:uncharacterized protein LOC119612036 [Lucilia sericata]|uniref:uncharacterized protein LOC119612036 n=1 Tax=Lucilia sericata TaxID=13632 RepID=UPI0018A813A4|nr:uncharacterized protein LOC119612036 [Lucilia sericata]
MKFAVLAFLACLCLVGASAKATGDFMVDQEVLQQYEYITEELAEEIMEIEPQTIFSGFFFVVKKVLKTFQGIACVVNEVYRVQVAAHNFLTDIALCGGELSQKVQTLVDAVKDIIETCRAIAGINESVCSNDHADIFGRGVVSSVKVGHKCASNMLSKLLRLNRQIKRAIKLMIQIKNVPGDTSECVLNAVDTLLQQFTEFPAKVKACTSTSVPPTENPCVV